MMGVGLLISTGEWGTSLAVQWLRVQASTAGARVQSLVGEPRSWNKLCGTAKKKIGEWEACGRIGLD